MKISTADEAARKLLSTSLGSALVRHGCALLWYYISRGGTEDTRKPNDRAL